MIYAIDERGEDARAFETIWQARQDINHTDLLLRANTTQEICAAIAETKDFILDDFECEYTGGDAMWSVTAGGEVIGMTQISEDMTLKAISQSLYTMEKLSTYKL